MRRLPSAPRPDWPARVENVGLTYHTHESADGPRPYWDESACYEFSAAEVDRLEKVIHELHHLLIDVADDIVTRGNWAQLGLPASAVPLIERSWADDDFSIYGRFDFAWMPGGAPKLLEYNADTPTALIEASVAQWHWLQDVKPGMDQFNSLHERLIAAWKRYGETTGAAGMIDFTSVPDNLEDEQTISYMMDTALQAGFQSRFTAIDQLGYDSGRRCFVPGDAASGPDRITNCFKLYPWEWLLREQFGAFLPTAKTRWIEPIWKALLSNKAILALAWEKNPNHPNLLPAFFSGEKLGSSYIKKPKLSREGANVTLVRNGATVLATEGSYGSEGYIYQAIAEIPEFDGNHPVVGGWVVDHEPAGMGIRESTSLITDNLSRFVPHFFSA